MSISGFARPLRAALLCAGLTSAFAAQAVVFSNSTPIAIPDSGPAAPYPSTIAVSGLTGPITKVTATLNGLTHTCNSDLVVLLVGPQGQSLILMANTGMCSDPGETTFTYTFDDAYGAMPDGQGSPPDSGSYAPTDNFRNRETVTALPATKARPTGPARVVPTGYLPSPAPADAPTGSALSIFNGSSGNGTWSLYVLDDYAEDSGTITNGWSLDITAAAAAPAKTVPTLGEWSLMLLATLLAGITALRLRRSEH